MEHSLQVIHLISQESLRVDIPDEIAEAAVALNRVEKEMLINSHLREENHLDCLAQLWEVALDDILGKSIPFFLLQTFIDHVKDL